MHLSLSDATAKIRNKKQKSTIFEFTFCLLPLKPMVQSIRKPDMQHRTK